MKLTNTHFSQLCEMAQLAAIKAGEYIQSQFDTDFAKTSKTGGDSLASQIVTAVDYKAQEIILEYLQESIDAYGLGLLTEEAVDDQSRLHKDYFWCIDPLDGTLPFSEHRTGYAVSIALISKTGDPVVGVVYIPDLKECYAAYSGSGVLLNDQPFVRLEDNNKQIHCYMDQSFLSAPYFEMVQSHFQEWARVSGYLQIQYHYDFGGVRNAIGVMSAGRGCYFKFPKPSKGCGSIWDYAATSLFMQELDLHVSRIDGHRLHLNEPTTTFMNHQGILYATDPGLVAFAKHMAKDWQASN